jgi:hypothetical protein
MGKGTRYPDKVIQFAVFRRIRGEPWKNIQTAITKEFKISPPTIRRMRDWVKLWEDLKNMPPSVKFVSAKVPKRIWAVYAKTRDNSMLMDVSRSFVESIYNAWKQRKDPMAAWALEMLHRMEQTAGPGSLGAAIAEYQKEKTSGNGASGATAKAGSNTPNVDVRR